ncbi:hypothetical protein ACFW1P_08100 [Paenibacillus sp. NPDC058910]
MGKIIMQQFVTLDGVMQAPGDLHEFEHGGWQRLKSREWGKTYGKEKYAWSISKR